MRRIAAAVCAKWCSMREVTNAWRFEGRQLRRDELRARSRITTSQLAHTADSASCKSSLHSLHLLVDITALVCSPEALQLNNKQPPKMIIGSIYLGKQVKKKYRAHQAEKAAQRLTEAVKVEDPSSELTLKAPPVSPTGSQLSLNSTPDTTSPSTVWSTHSPIRSSRSSTDLHSAISRYSTTSQPRSEFEQKQIKSIFQQPSKDLLDEPSDLPPDYDSVVASPVPSHSQPASAQTAEPPSAWSTTSAYPAWPPSHNAHDHCPTCLAMMQQQHQHHGHHFHHAPASVPRHAQVQHPNLSHAPSQHASIREVSEMPSSPVHDSHILPRVPASIIEAPDTEVHEMDSVSAPRHVFPLVELPADIPEAPSTPVIDSKKENSKGESGTDSSRSSIELPAS